MLLTISACHLLSHFSAIYNINERPRGLKGMREYILAVRAMLNGEHTEYAGRDIHTKWVRNQADNPVPIYIAAIVGAALGFSSPISNVVWPYFYGTK